jgi:hypothetical protein
LCTGDGIDKQHQTGLIERERERERERELAVWGTGRVKQTD